MSVSSLQTGQDAENTACQYLTSHGLKTLQRNFRCARGEIDIVMEDAQSIVFVEVRYRKNKSYGDGAESITYTKQQKLIRAALYYLQVHPKYSNRPSRFDVVSVSKNTESTNIDWIKDAFQV